MASLDYIAEKAGAVVIPQKPAYSSRVLSYRDEIIFTDSSIRDYWDEAQSLMVNRDINAAINLKRLGLGIFPSIKRRSGNLVIVGTMSDSTTKEILHTLHRAARELTSYRNKRLMWEYVTRPTHLLDFLQKSGTGNREQKPIKPNICKRSILQITTQTPNIALV